MELSKSQLHIFIDKKITFAEGKHIIIPKEVLLNDGQKKVSVQVKSIRFHRMPIIVIIVGAAVKKNIVMKQKKKPKKQPILYRINREFIIANFARHTIPLVGFLYLI